MQITDQRRESRWEEDVDLMAETRIRWRQERQMAYVPPPDQKGLWKDIKPTGTEVFNTSRERKKREHNTWIGGLGLEGGINNYNT